MDKAKKHRAKKHRVRATWDLVVNLLLITVFLAASFIILVAVWMRLAKVE
jgi:hypothetical protein